MKSPPTVTNPAGGFPAGGSLIILVMVILSFLSLLTVVITERIVERRQIEQRLAHTADDAVLFRGGLEIALAALDQWKTEEGAWRSEHEEWTAPLDYLELEADDLEGDKTLTIRIEDAARRIPFHALEEGSFQRLFSHLSAEREPAGEMEDILLDWMDEDDFRKPLGAEFPEYDFRDDDPLRLPPNRRIRSQWEWDFFLANALLPEWSEEERGRIRGIFHFLPVESLNINTADDDVLDLLGDIYRINPGRIREGRAPDAGPGLRRTVGIENVAAFFPDDGDRAGFTLATETEVFRVTVTLGDPEAGQTRGWVVFAGAPEARDGEGPAVEEHPAGFSILRVPE